MRKILIVEDDILLNRTLGYNLASDGYEVTAAYNYKDAVSHLKAIEFDIALLDINLPDGSGLDLLRALRQNGDLTPAILQGCSKIPTWWLPYSPTSSCAKRIL